MEHLKHKDSFKEFIDIFKEGYNASSKTFVWAKVLNEWGRVGVGILILLGLLTPKPQNFRNSIK